MNIYKKSGPYGLENEDGTTSLPLRSAIPVNLIMQFRPLPKSENSSDQTPRVTTSSGQSYTLTELCMCTDYSKPLTGQIGLNLGESLTPSGVTALNDSGEARCVECKKMRPYVITSLSM